MFFVCTNTVLPIMRSSCICMLWSNDGANKPSRVSVPWIFVLLICNNWNKRLFEFEFEKKKWLLRNFAHRIGAWYSTQNRLGSQAVNVVRYTTYGSIYDTLLNYRPNLLLLCDEAWDRYDQLRLLLDIVRGGIWHPQRKFIFAQCKYGGKTIPISRGLTWPRCIQR